MGFSTLVFLFLFLPSAVIGGQIFSGRPRVWFFLCISLLFCLWTGLYDTCVLVFVTVLNYAAAVLLRRKQTPWILRTAVLADVLILVFFRYAPEGWEVRFPLGLSFYVFQLISAVTDIYRGEKYEGNIIDFLLYTGFFGRLLSGPVIRLHEFHAAERRTSAEDLFTGFETFLLGLCQKVILADRLGEVISSLSPFYNLSAVSVSLAWMASAVYALQLYHDFAGYSRMVIGIGQMLGITVPVNFNYPYCAATFTDFWRRWHMTLSFWFRDYVYIPLGGSRKGRLRTVINLVIVWLLTALWHGSALNYLCWGGLAVGLLLLEKLIIRPDRFVHSWQKVLYRIFVLVSLPVLWLVFGLSPERAGKLLMIMFGMRGHAFWNLRAFFFLQNSWFYILTAVIFSMPVLARLQHHTGKTVRIIYGIFLVLASVLTVSFVVLEGYSPFIYTFF